VSMIITSFTDQYKRGQCDWGQADHMTQYGGRRRNRLAYRTSEEPAQQIRRWPQIVHLLPRPTCPHVRSWIHLSKVGYTKLHDAWQSGVQPPGNDMGGCGDPHGLRIKHLQNYHDDTPYNVLARTRGGAVYHRSHGLQAAYLFARWCNHGASYKPQSVEWGKAQRRIPMAT
jgi:hypothetical protein